MLEGFHRDDRFRMVEDEFLDAAKQFTQHLHATEYQKMKRAARLQNATTINSISRPVTTRMPDQTKRKVDSMARAKRQLDIIHSLTNRKSHGSGSGEDSDEHGSAWLGTALHGLMKSPRQSATSLDTIGKATAMPRAAAGFHKPTFQNGSKHIPPRLVQQNQNDRPTRNPISPAGSVTEWDDDGDLDAPLLVPKFSAPAPENPSITVSAPLGVEGSRAEESKSVPLHLETAAPDESRKERNDSPSRALVDTRHRIARRLEQARAREMKQKDDACRSELDIIPTFLSSV